MNRAEIEKNILRTLNASGGVPMPESSLVRAVQFLSRPAEPTIGDVLDALKATETRQYVDGVSDDLDERSWVLTKTGKHKSRQL